MTQGDWIANLDVCWTLQCSSGQGSLQKTDYDLFCYDAVAELPKPVVER